MSQSRHLPTGRHTGRRRLGGTWDDSAWPVPAKHRRMVSRSKKQQIMERMPEGPLRQLVRHGGRYSCFGRLEWSGYKQHRGFPAVKWRVVPGFKRQRRLGRPGHRSVCRGLWAKPRYPSCREMVAMDLVSANRASRGAWGTPTRSERSS